DVGTDDGVFVGAAAICGDAILGFVERTSPRRSRVRTVLSRDFRAAAGVAAGPDLLRLVGAGTGGPLLSSPVGDPEEACARCRPVLGRVDVSRAAHRVGCIAPPLPPGEDGFPAEGSEGFLLGFVEGNVRAGAARVRPAVDPGSAHVVLVAARGPAGLHLPARL